jgi:prepilin-type N-terminal cleavage/methylation domain-containing protein
MIPIQKNYLKGFTLVEIMIVIAIIALLAAIAIPNFVKARATSQATTCINNLRQIDTAIQQFSIEARKHVGDTVSLSPDLTPYIKLNSQGSIPTCPVQGGTYTLNPIGSNPAVSCSFSTLNPPHQF